MTRRPLRIAIVCSTLNQLGGPATYIRSLYRNLHGAEFQMTLIFCSSGEADLREYMLAGGVPAERMVFIPHAKKKLLLPFVLELARIFRLQKYDIVHAVETQTQVLAGVAAKLAGKKNVLCHCVAQFLPSTISWPKRVLFWLLNLLLKDYFTCSIAVSHGLANELVKKGFRPKDRVRVVHLGIEPLHQEPLVRLAWDGLKKGAPLLGTLSRISVEKGLDRFLKAAVIVAHEVPSARFAIAGTGADEARLKKLARELSISDKVRFLGRVEDAETTLRSFDIFVLPSLREGLPIALLEAMSVGRPAVASDIEGVREVIRDGEDGILANTADIEFFAGRLIALCRNPGKAVEMGRAAFQRVQSDFSVEREMKTMREIYIETAAHGEDAQETRT